MTHDQFTAALAKQLRLLGYTFDRAAVLAFVARVWPWIEDDPDVTGWARRFVEAGLVETRP
jgi:hypothetical protein